MTINGSTNSSAWTYKMEVTETSTSLANRTSTIQVKTYIGRANSQSYLGGGYSNTVSITGTSSQTSSGTIPYPTYINGGAWLELKTFTFTVPNNSNPTVVTISSTFSSGDFTPSYASASGTMQLTILHLNPTIQDAEMVETNQAMITLGLPDTTIARWLSQKRITLHAIPNDNANLSYKLTHQGSGYTIPTNGYSNSNILDANYISNDLDIINNNAMIREDVIDDMSGHSATFLKVQINGVSSYPNAIDYFKPIIENTSTSIKRKSGEWSETLQRNANLTDNIVSLNLKASIYKTNNIIGNNNSVTQVGYKIWDTDSSEPVNYTLITPTPTPDANGVITISDYEISNINYIDMYNYKIIVTDNYGYDATIDDGTVPIGVSIWSEYKDHVDFLALTVGGYNPFEYSETETIVGVWLDKPLYRKVIDIGSYTWTNGSNTFAHNITNLDTMVEVDYLMQYSNGNWYSNWDNLNSKNWIVDSTNLTMQCSSNTSFQQLYIILEYTKTV